MHTGLGIAPNKKPLWVISTESFSSQEGALLILKGSPLHVGHRTAKEPQIHLEKRQWRWSVQKYIVYTKILKGWILPY